MTSSSVEPKTIAKELRENKNILAHFCETEGSDYETFTAADPDLDREQADGVDGRNLAEMSATGNMFQISTLLARANEEHRIRRDYNIINAGHRELMLSALRILSMRNENLMLYINKNTTNKSEK